MQDLSRAGKRLKGFCRTNLFKRLESSGHAFLLRRCVQDMPGYKLVEPNDYLPK